MIYQTRHNKKKYNAYLFRVPRGSDLAEKLAEQARNGDSVQFTITRLLCTHYGVEVPQKYYRTRKTVVIC